MNEFSYIYEYMCLYCVFVKKSDYCRTQKKKEREIEEDDDVVTDMWGQCHSGQKPFSKPIIVET
jgi:hypothetical protein